jgi:hypothetical protein
MNELSWLNVADGVGALGLLHPAGACGDGVRGDSTVQLFGRCAPAMYAVNGGGGDRERIVDNFVVDALAGARLR